MGKPSWETDYQISLHQQDHLNGRSGGSAALSIPTDRHFLPKEPIQAMVIEGGLTLFYLLYTIGTALPQLAEPFLRTLPKLFPLIFACLTAMIRSRIAYAAQET